MTSLNARQLRGLNKVGDIMLPGNRELLSFSASNCAHHANRILDYMYEDDRVGIQGLLAVFALLPMPIIRMVLWLTSKERYFPGPIGTTLRLVQLGVKGLVMSLYYSDLEEGSIHSAIRWQTQIVCKEEQL